MSRKLIILGGGESGVGAALLAKKEGYDVFLSDAGSLKESYRKELDGNEISFEEGGHTDRVLLADEVVKSPGIPDSNAMVKTIRKKGIRVISEIELAWRHKGNARVIAITGSNGKSTCTALTYHICKTAGLNCAMVGNIGFSFAGQVARDPKELYVAEISSFQLDDIHEFRPEFAVLLNITPDHLDRYDYDFNKYVKSKFRITENQLATDHFVYNDDDEAIKQYLENKKLTANPLPFSMNRELPHGAFIKDGDMYLRTGAEQVSMSIYDFALKGKHNQYNTMAACVATATMEIRKNKIREAVQSFSGLEHRMEHVATIRGIEFVNDSKATNVNSTWYALESMQKPVVLILGGVDKGNDYSLIEDLVKEKVKAIICLGVDNHKIHQAFDAMVPTIVDTTSAEEAVQAAFHFSEKGDVVLLSPACASFDLFLNYEDRGDKFRRAVRDL